MIRMVLSLALLFFGCQSRIDVAAVMEKGKAAFKAARYEEAIVQFEKAVRAQPVGVGRAQVERLGEVGRDVPLGDEAELDQQVPERLAGLALQARGAFELLGVELAGLDQQFTDACGQWAVPVRSQNPQIEPQTRGVTATRTGGARGAPVSASEPEAVARRPCAARPVYKTAGSASVSAWPPPARKGAATARSRRLPVTGVATA